MIVDNSPQVEEYSNFQGAVSNNNSRIPHLIIDTKRNQEVGIRVTPIDSPLGVQAGHFPDKIPADFEQAINHQKACLVGVKIDRIGQEHLCSCCARTIEKTALKITCNLKEFSFIGSGYPLYFSFLKYCTIFLTLILIFSGGFNILTNAIYGKECTSDTTASNSKCKSNWITKLSLGNKQNESGLMFVQECLNLLTILIVIALLQVFRRQQRQLDADCDEADISANDYTLLFERIPIEFQALDNDYDDDLKFFIETSVKQRLLQKMHAEAAGTTATAQSVNLDVVKINLCYNLQEQLEIAAKKEKLIKKKQKILKAIYKNKVTDISVVEKVNGKIHAIDEKLNQFQMKFADGKGTEFMKKYFTGKALVSFLTEQMKQDVLELYKDKKHVKDLLYHGEVLRVTQAPQPTDMYWENLHISESEKTKRLITGFAISIMSLVICGGLIYLLLLAQKASKSDNANEPASATVQAIAILLSICITLLNVALQWILKYLTGLEACYTRTEYNINIAKKIAWATFINSALIQFFIDVVFDTTGDTFGVIFGEGGLAFNQNYVFISNMILPFVLEAIDPPGIFQQLAVKYRLNNQPKCFLTQAQLNTEFERPPFEIYQKYALNLKTMFIVAFYSPILPIGIVYSMIAIALIYWVDKYNLLRRKTIKFQQSAELSIEMTEMIEYILPIYSLSNTIFFIYIVGSQDVSALSWIGLAIGVIHTALPMQEWNERFFKIREAASNEIDYHSAAKIFLTDYERENPATQLISRRSFIKQTTHTTNTKAADTNKLNVAQKQKLQQHQVLNIERIDENLVSLEDEQYNIKSHRRNSKEEGMLSHPDYPSESATKLNQISKHVNAKQETADTTSNPFELHKQTQPPGNSKYSQPNVQKTDY